MLIEADTDWHIHAPPRLARIYGTLPFGAKPSGAGQQSDCIDPGSVFQNATNRLSIPSRRHTTILRTSRGIFFSQFEFSNNTRGESLVDVSHAERSCISKAS